ncbi:MAG: hemerythrin domain-containing protein [Chloroflexota bacterium]
MEPTISHGYACSHQAEKPTQILSDEHRIIERVLGALEKLAQGPVSELEPWKKALDFIRHFADQCHHVKEERMLFPALAEHGIPEEGGPIGTMLMEHEEGRSYVRAMLAAISLIESNNDAGKASLLSSAQAYCRLLREHIQKEDDVLFRMADEVIPEADQKQLAADFAQHEAEEMGPGAHEKYLKIAADLERTVDH